MSEPTLAEKVAKVRPGDRVRAMFEQDGRTATVEGEVCELSPYGLFFHAAGSLVRSAGGTPNRCLVDVEVLAPTPATAEDLDACGPWSVVTDRDEAPWPRYEDGSWRFGGVAPGLTSAKLIEMYGPITVRNKIEAGEPA